MNNIRGGGSGSLKMMVFGKIFKSQKLSTTGTVLVHTNSLSVICKMVQKLTTDSCQCSEVSGVNASGAKGPARAFVVQSSIACTTARLVLNLILFSLY